MISQPEQAMHNEVERIPTADDAKSANTSSKGKLMQCQEPAVKEPKAEDSASMDTKLQRGFENIGSGVNSKRIWN